MGIHEGLPPEDTQGATQGKYSSLAIPHLLDRM